MVEQLIGEDIILWGTTIFGKPAHGGKATPWHQDGAYYPIRPLETLSIWIALDDAVPDNGCMRFIPGSHKDRKIFSHHWEEDQDLTINRVCDSEHFDEASARGTGEAVHARPLPLRPRAGPPIGRTAQGPRLRQAGLVPPARARPLGTERFLSRPLILGWA